MLKINKPRWNKYEYCPKEEGKYEENMRREKIKKLGGKKIVERKRTNEDKKRLL